MEAFPKCSGVVLWAIRRSVLGEVHIIQNCKVQKIFQPSPKISPLRKGKFSFLNSNPHNTQATSLGLPHTFRAQCYIRGEQKKHIKLINELPVTTLYFFPKKKNCPNIKNFGHCVKKNILPVY